MLPLATPEAAEAEQGSAVALPGRRAGGEVMRVLHSSYPGVAESVGEARHQLERALAGVPAAGDAVFCLGEAAANAVLHSRSGQADGRFTVTTDVLPGALVVLTVTDEGGPWTGREADTYPHGLEIVGELAACVRVVGDDEGRTVVVVLAWQAS